MPSGGIHASRSVNCMAAVTRLEVIEHKAGDNQF